MTQFDILRTEIVESILCSIVTFILPLPCKSTLHFFMQGTAIQFPGLDALLWGIVATLQYYSLPAMALSIAAIGIALVMSGDDVDRKGRLKHWIFNILIWRIVCFWCYNTREYS